MAVFFFLPPFPARNALISTDLGRQRLFLLGWSVHKQGGEVYFSPWSSPGSVRRRKKKQNGRPQAKASGGSVWKNLSAFPKRFNICWMFFIFFPPLFHREEEEEEGGNSFQRDVFLAKCCHLCAPECNCLQSLNPPQPDARVNVEKCPCVQKADVFL